MEDKVLYNVLKTIKKNKSAGDSAPDSAYVNALATIGLISAGWDTYLTTLGESVLGMLQNKFEKW